MPETKSDMLLEQSSSKTHKRELYIGLMSGTSIDGIDGVLAEITPEGKLSTIATETLPWNDSMKTLLNGLCAENSVHDRIKTAGLAANAIATAEATVCVLLLEKAQINHTQVRAIGSHGQTIRHHPNLGFSVQLDNGPLLANLTDIDAIVNFRAADLANEGEGAPLTQAFHQSLLSSKDKTRFVLNLGGIANVTALSTHGQVITAFDTGPANTLLDYVCRSYLGCTYDKDGAHAAAGTIDEQALSKLMAHKYFTRPYPKSTGREEFNVSTIDFMLEGLHKVEPKQDKPNQHDSLKTPKEGPTVANSTADLEQAQISRVQDILCTLTEFTAQSSLNSIAQIIKDHKDLMTEQRELILCGGGALNAYLKERMQAIADKLNLNLKVILCSDLGIEPQYLEAQAFAFFAFCCSHAISLNLCSSTKAKRPSILGTICPAPTGFYARAMSILNKIDSHD